MADAVGKVGDGSCVDLGSGGSRNQGQHVETGEVGEKKLFRGEKPDTAANVNGVRLAADGCCGANLERLCFCVEF